MRQIFHASKAVPARAVCGAVLLSASALSGCKPEASSHRFWSQVNSPMNDWRASVETLRSGSMESATTDTSVYLQPLNDDSPPEKVLEFHQRGIVSANPPLELHMHWADENHLDVTYGQATLMQQTVLYSVVVIRLHGPDAFGLTAPVSNSGDPQLSEHNTP